MVIADRLTDVELVDLADSPRVVQHGRYTKQAEQERTECSGLARASLASNWRPINAPEPYCRDTVGAIRSL